MPAWYQVLLQNYVKYWTMDAEGFSIVDNRAGVTFGVELYVPWDMPEMTVDLDSAGILQGRDARAYSGQPRSESECSRCDCGRHG